MTYHLKDFGSFYIGGRCINISGQPTKHIQRNRQISIELDINGNSHLIMMDVNNEQVLQKLLNH